MKNLFRILVSALTCATLSAAPEGYVNVLTLGVKNDGSEDVSVIVNKETETKALYFPAGTYKVANPIYLKNPIRGEAYSRVPVKTQGTTWFASAIQNTDGSVGVLNFGGYCPMTLEDLNISCASHECGIRIDKCEQMTATFIERVGIFDVRSYGLLVRGGGSRPIFAQTMTIFGAADYPEPCVGIRITAADNRFSNIELMGVRVGIENFGGYNYGNNIHIWTGPMSGKDNGTWWHGTRGIVLANNSTFSGAQIYPDTCFYAFEAKTPGCAVHIQNLFYWEDDSTLNSPDYDGEFFHSDHPAIFQIDGGEIAVMNPAKTRGRTAKFYKPGQPIRNVTLRSEAPMRADLIDRLCLSDELPDYTLTYKDEGFCKVADILMAEDSGVVEADLLVNNSELYRLSLRKSAGKAPEFKTIPETENIRTAEQDGVWKIYVRNPAGNELKARFITRIMGERFRPVDHKLLHTLWDNRPRYSEVLPLETK